MIAPRPIDWIRLLTAFGTAGVVAALLAGLLTMSAVPMAYVLLLVLAFELLIVLPIYLALHWAGRVTRTTVLVAGFSFASAPWAWFAWPLRYPALKSTSSVDGVQTMVDGVPTLAGWLQYGGVVLLFGFFGLLAAHGFWLALAKRRAIDGEPIPPPASGVRPSIHEKRALWRTVGVLVAIAVILVLPVATKDRSCHNVFRDVPIYSLPGNVPSARPKVSFHVQVPMKDWNELARFLHAYGKSASLEVLNLSEQDENSKQLYVSLCNESGVVISVLDMAFFFGPPREPRTEQSISVFGLRPEADWRQQAAALESALRSSYGDKLRREDRE